MRGAVMRGAGRLLARKPIAWAVVLLTLLATALGGWQATRVDQDDDVLKFLPKGSRAVAEFEAINERFGGLDVALAGILAGDPFDAAFLRRLRALTKSLNEEPQIAYALSLANVEDYAFEKTGGIRADYLVSALPRNEADKTALRDKVMSKDHIVGNLISGDGKSVLLYCFGKHGVRPRELAALVKDRVTAAMPELPKYWGGAPFVSTYIYDVTKQDMRRLTPWAILVKLLIVTLAFRSAIGVLLTVASAGIAIAVAEGLMGATHTPANVVLGSLPVILFALGSAYATHVVVRYFALRTRDNSAADAVADALQDVGPPALGAGLVTAAGLLSFWAMDIEPLRQFGLIAALGILAALALSLTFVPAVLVLANARPRNLGGERFVAALGRLCAAMSRHRGRVAIGLGLVAAAAGLFTSRVQARMEASAFYAKGSPPERAESFLKRHFGGSQFIELGIDGDMTDPGVLREVQRVAAEISLLPHVSSVTHIGQVLAMTGEAMAGERRIPAKAAQVAALYRFLAGRPSVRQLVTDDHQHALVIAKIDTDEHEAVSALLDRVEALTGEHPTPQVLFPALHAYRKGSLGLLDRFGNVVAEVRALLHGFGVEPPDAAQLPGLLDGAMKGQGDLAASKKKAQDSLARFLASDESVLEPEQRKYAPAVAAAVAALGEHPDNDRLQAAIAEATRGADDEDLASDLVASLPGPLDEAWRHSRARARADSLLAEIAALACPRGSRPACAPLPAGDKGERLRARLGDDLLDLDDGAALMPAPPSDPSAGRIDYTVTGVPVLNRGLSHSVLLNQIRSLAMSLGLVLLIMIGMYRSLTAGLVAVAPTSLALLVIYGAMSLIGLHLEIGTSMLACLIIGAGVDYGVHLLHGWRVRDGETLEQAAARAAEHSGLASWTNAVMVSAGFLVLTLGQARPLKIVGGLTGAAMLIAALATFSVIPVLARRRRYGAAS